MRIILLVVLTICVQLLNAQFSEIEFRFSDGEFETVLTVGLSPTGDNEFIDGVDIYAPPPAPSGAFDAYFSFNSESYIKKVVSNTNTETKEFQVNFSNAAGNNPIRIEWDASKLPSNTWRFYFTDSYGGSFLAKTDLKEFNGTITPETINAVVQNELKLIIEYDPTYTSLNEGSNLPNSTTLHQNYPNPFNPSTTIAFELSESSQTLLSIYNVYGQRISSIINSPLSAGRYRYNWTTNDLSSGTYFYQLKTKNEVLTKQMTLIK
jgi:hypothetical protein